MKRTPPSSSRPVKSEKKENGNSSISNFFAQELLSTQHEILKENHESLQRDHESLKLRFKHVSEMNDDLMKNHFEKNQTKELVETNIRLGEELKRETSENEKLKKKIEDMERMENELRNMHQELLNEEEEKMKKIQNQLVELTEKFDEVVKECAELKSFFEEEAKKNPMNQEVNVVVDHYVNEAVTGQENNDVIPMDTVIENIRVDETKSSDPKPHHDDNAGNNEVIVVEDHNLNSVKKCLRYDDDGNDEVMVLEDQSAERNVNDTIMIISDDDSDVEFHSLPRDIGNTTTPPQCTAVHTMKQEPQQSEGPISSKEQVEIIKRTIPEGSEGGNNQSKKIFVGGIPLTVTEDELKDFFATYGTVVEHQIIKDHETKRSRGFGFVVFESEEVVDELLSKGNTIYMMNTQVTINKAVPKKPLKHSSPVSLPSYGSSYTRGPYRGIDGGYVLIRPHGSAPASGFARGYGYGRGGVEGPVFRGGYGGGGSLGSYGNVPPLGYSSRLGPCGSGGGGGYGGGGYESGGSYGRSSRYHPYTR